MGEEIEYPIGGSDEISSVLGLLCLAVTIEQDDLFVQDGVIDVE